MKQFDFSKNIKVSVNIQDLEKLGWNFDDIYQDTYNAHQNSFKLEHNTLDDTYDMNMAESYVQNTYHVDITVTDVGYTSWCLTNTKKAQNGIWEGSDSNWSGDDDGTIRDIQKLYERKLLWNIIQ